MRDNFFYRFKEWGFEKGWGDTAERVKETMRSLSEVFQSPDPLNMEKFLGRLPTIFNVVLFSVHGYFGQSNVLGLPDTGGQVGLPNLAKTSCVRFFTNRTLKINFAEQVVYVLDQVVALEEELLLRIKQQGLNVKPQILVVS